jgi:hypothetical protein
LEYACANQSFIAGLISAIKKAIVDFIDSEERVVGGALAIVMVPGASSVILLGAALLSLLELLEDLLETIDPDSTVSAIIDRIREILLEDTEGSSDSRRWNLYLADVRCCVVRGADRGSGVGRR